MWKLRTKQFLWFKNTVTPTTLKQETELDHTSGISWTDYLQGLLLNNSHVNPFPTSHQKNYLFISPHCWAWVLFAILALLLPPSVRRVQQNLFPSDIVPHAPLGTQLLQFATILIQTPAKKPSWPDSENQILHHLIRQTQYISLSPVLTPHTKKQGMQETSTFSIYWASAQILCPTMGHT